MPGIEGTTFAGFEILHKLGQGGMGAVYRARQIALNRIVALKVMAGNLAQDDDYVHRFRREAASAAKIDHPNAVKVFAFGEESGTHYIAMEYIEGETLRGKIEREGRIDPGEALVITEQIAGALGYAWDKAHLIHRDIKPDNIFLTTGGEAKLGDLGLAKSVGGASTGLTATGAMMGSPHYISPEQGRGDGDVDFRADIYSLGCTLYHMLTGKTPYEAENIYALIHMHVYGAPPAIFRAWAECPVRLGTLVGKMLAKNREQRPGSYSELLGELGAVRQWLDDRRSGAIARAADDAGQPRSPAGVPVGDRGGSRPPGAIKGGGRAGRNRGLLAGIGVAALLLVGGIAWMVGGRSRSGGKAEPPPPTVADRIAWATKDTPFVNSLGMKFVPVPGTDVLFSVYETRVRDWDAFLKESRYKWDQTAGFEQTADHPVVMVSRDDAKAFCAWMSKKEGVEYRLPTDDEWSAAMGPDRYPWGADWRPPEGEGNFAGNESRLGNALDPEPSDMLRDWNDVHPRTSPVGSYRANRFGLYDLSGNVWEWCEDAYDAAVLKKHRIGGGSDFPSDILADITEGKERGIVRGASWLYSSAGRLLSAYRLSIRFKEHGHPSNGFRCVVEILRSSAGASRATAQPSQLSAWPPAQESQWATVTKDNPFVNSLGMKFVPVPGTDVLFSVYETRVRDWDAFVKESGYAWNEKAGFEQTPDHPVVRVSWNDAKAFCAWLSKKEGREYRLPTDDEWSAAVGSDKYPWGDEWPPPADAGNFPGEESRIGKGDDPKLEYMCPGWKDAHARTASAGSYRANGYGLHDLAGNVREWCEDWHDAAILEKRRVEGGIGDPSDAKELAEAKQGNVRRVVRGGSWNYGSETSLRWAYRYGHQPDERRNYNGFRCVVGRSASSPRGAGQEPPPAGTESKVSASPSPGAQVSSLAAATKDNPFVNSLGMRFVPVPGTEVLFSVWETRVRDWDALIKESGYAWNEKAGFEQTPDHPVVKVSWDDAKAFCAWLSKKEGREYRLPTDDEWSAAVGPGEYPWGDEWPPPADAGNFPGEESKLGKGDDPKPEWMCPGWKDTHARTSSAGSYRVNRYGLHDLAGNVWEWCEDWYDAAILEKRRVEGGIGDPSDAKELAEAKQGNVRRVVRGGSWYYGNERSLRSARRVGHHPDARYVNLGFRCVVGRSASSP